MYKCNKCNEQIKKGIYCAKCSLNILTKTLYLGFIGEPYHRDSLAIKVNNVLDKIT